MSHVSEEIASQPSCWERAVALGRRARDLPRAGERVAAVGCGTSWFVAQSYAALRERAGHGETDAFAASEFPSGRRYDRIVAITRSGTTTEIINLLKDVGGQDVVAITADGNASVGQAAAATIALDFADERSVVQTRFATTTLTLLRAQLGEDLGGLIADAFTCRDQPLPTDLLAAEQLTFLGTGWTIGLAHEAALKLREAAAVWTESYPAMEYRHGPISIAEKGRATWMFGQPPAGLADDIAATGATFVSSGDLDPLAHLIVAQRLAVEQATARALDPDQPRHLSRSVVLGDADA